MTNVEADKRLKTPFNGSGSYLIRDSQSSPGDYALSVRHKDQVYHYDIYQLESGEFYIKVHVTFKTIVALVTHYKQQAYGLCNKLIQPCALFDNKEWEIADRGQITLKRKLGNGLNSEVWEGMWNGTTLVAVRTYNSGTMTAHDFLQTVALMEKLRHPNIIQFYAMCTKEEPRYIITEFMRHGSLVDYLRGEGRSTLTKFPQLIDMASQVAEGMAYLEEQNCVHRDLVARSILVGENLVCKVADFKKARVIDEDIYEAESEEKFPVKWTAIEAAMYLRYSTKSDVWSFGIVLYEIVTYGNFPYPGMTNAETLEKVVMQGYRMSQPSGCPDKFYNIMLSCWREEPENRPTFEALKWQLKDFFY